MQKKSGELFRELISQKQKKDGKNTRCGCCSKLQQNKQSRQQGNKLRWGPTKKDGKKLNKRFGEWVRNNNKKKPNWIVPIHSECCQSSNAQSTNDTKREKNQNCINVTVYTVSSNNSKKNSQNLKSETLIQVQRKQHGKVFSDGDCVWLWVAHKGKSTVLVGLTNCTVCVQSLRLASSECGCCRTHASRCVLCGRTPSPNVLPNGYSTQCGNCVADLCDARRLCVLRTLVGKQQSSRQTAEILDCVRVAFVELHTHVTFYAITLFSRLHAIRRQQTCRVCHCRRRNENWVEFISCGKIHSNGNWTQCRRTTNSFPSDSHTFNLSRFAPAKSR